MFLMKAEHGRTYSIRENRMGCKIKMLLHDPLSNNLSCEYELMTGETAVMHCFYGYDNKLSCILIFISKKFCQKTHPSLFHFDFPLPNEVSFTPAEQFYFYLALLCKLTFSQVSQGEKDKNKRTTN